MGKPFGDVVEHLTLGDHQNLSTAQSGAPLDVPRNVSRDPFSET